MYIEIKKNKNYKKNIEILKALTSDIQVREYGLSAFIQSDCLNSYITRNNDLSGKLVLKVDLFGNKNYKTIINMTDILTIFTL